MKNRVDHYNKMMEFLSPIGDARSYFIKKDYDYKLHDPMILQVGWPWIQNHPKDYQAGLVDYYIELTKIHVKEEYQPMYNQLLQAIDGFVGFLNQEVPVK